MIKLNCVKMDRDNALKFLSSVEAKLCMDLIRWHNGLSLININENGLSLILGKTELDNVLRMFAKTSIIIIVVGRSHSKFKAIIVKCILDQSSAGSLFLIFGTRDQLNLNGVKKFFCDS